MSKKKQILKLLSLGKSIKEIAKSLKIKPAYVYYIRWLNNKDTQTHRKATFKSPRSKLVQAIVQSKKDVEAVKAKNTERLRLDSNLNLHIGKPDVVNNPPHYTDGGVDTLTYIEAKDLNYRLGNVVKYVSRAGKKAGSDPLQDLMKARFYLQREIDVRRDA